MNYELLSKLSMEEAEKYKNEAVVLKKRNEMKNLSFILISFLIFLYALKQE